MDQHTNEDAAQALAHPSAGWQPDCKSHLIIYEQYAARISQKDRNHLREARSGFECNSNAHGLRRANRNATGRRLFGTYRLDGGIGASRCTESGCLEPSKLREMIMRCDTNKILKKDMIKIKVILDAR